MSEVLKLQNINQSFFQGKNELKVLSNLKLTLKRGEKVAIVGSSGSGKSSLLHIAGLLEKPLSGNIIICGKNAAESNDKVRTIIRKTSLGFVYQNNFLLPEFTAFENILIPQLINNTNIKLAKKRTLELLRSIQMHDRADHRPSELSGGEQQRIAIARSIANFPEIIIADEPTGNLDSLTGKITIDLLLSLAKNIGMTILVATHDMKIANRMDRVLKLDNGVLINVN